MSEYSEVEQPFLQQLAGLGWTVIDQGTGVPNEAAPSLRTNFRQWLLPEVFDATVAASACCAPSWRLVVPRRPIRRSRRSTRTKG